MERCWSWNPDFRPHFENIRMTMQTYIEKKVCDKEVIKRVYIVHFYVHPLAVLDLKNL